MKKTGDKENQYDTILTLSKGDEIKIYEPKRAGQDEDHWYGPTAYNWLINEDGQYYIAVEPGHTGEGWDNGMYVAPYNPTV